MGEITGTAPEDRFAVLPGPARLPQLHAPLARFEPALAPGTVSKEDTTR